MQVRSKYGISIVFCLVIAACLVSAVLPLSALAQTFVTPGPNTNIVGVTPNLAHVPDFQLKQQQEPSCIVRPGNESYIMCAYNDLRASDIPALQGDGWMGVSMSNDEADTWFSRLAPGYLGHPDSIGMGFAADPSLVAIPGNSPGLAILNYIAGHRGSSNSVLAIQRWVEFPQEDRDFWKPESPVRIVTTSDIEGGFIDKPSFFYLIDNPAEQTEITQHIEVEGEAAPISITTPTGTLVVVYAVFPEDSEGSRLMLRRSTDNGVTWSDAILLADGKSQINGSSVTAFGNKIAVVYRQAGGTFPGYLCDPTDERYDSHMCGDDDHHNKKGGHKNKHHYCDDQTNEGCLDVIPDAVAAKVCTNNTEFVCMSSDEIFEICPFDQPASGATFRTSTFPWLAYDGSRLWAFSAHRNPGGSCIPVPDAPGQFVGKPKIVAMSSVNGLDWVGAGGSSDEPIVIAPRSEGFQVMPVAFGTKGRVDLAWTDTYLEEMQEEPLPSGNPDIYINDYRSGNARVFRKADVWMTRLEASCDSSTTNGCTPTIEDPVRVSSYAAAMETEVVATAIYEIEADFKNLRTHVSGTMAFTGDYKAMATPPFRQIANGKWIPNSLPGGSAGTELPGFTDSQNIFVAWGDNRDVEGEFVADPEGALRLLYTPPVNSDANPGGAVVSASEIEPDDVVEPQSTMLATDTPDHEDGMAGADLSTCVVGGNEHTRTRDVNVYGSLIRDQASLVAPTPVKPLGSIQRMYPLEITNIDPENAASYCLQIANQPDDLASTTGLASFYQLPAIAPFEDGDQLDLLDVFAPAGSSASRAVFVTTGDASTVITVNAYEGACPVASGDTFGPLVNAVRVGNGPLRDPEFCDTAACDSVLVNETHDIILAAPALQAPALQAPALQAPAMQAPALQAPALQAPALQAPTFAAPALQAPALQAPALQAPLVLAPALQAPALQAPALQAPALQAPALQAPALQAAAPGDIVYQDISYVVSTDANVTTTYSADIKINGLDLDSAAVQMIAWTPNVYTSTEDCLAVPAANQQIIAYRDLDAPSLQAVTLPQTFSPTNQNPYAGELSFMGSPDKDVVITIRILATGLAKATLQGLQQQLEECRADPFCDADSGEFGAARLISFGASAHQCSTDDAVVNTTADNPPDCLNNGFEKIQPDLAPPIITVPANFSVEADRPEGAVVTYSASALDNVDPNPIFSCTPESGSVIALSPGGTTITCYAEDYKSNSTFDSFTVYVVDTIAPTFPSLADVSAEATSASGAVVTYSTPVASDTVDTSPTVSCLPESGSAFVLGSTTVTCTATDASDNESSRSFVVAVSDTTPPVLNMPSSITVEPRDPADPDPQAGTFALDASGSVTVEANLPPPNGARISFAATATDTVSDPSGVSVNCSPQSGDVFAFGSSTVSCSASDGTNTSPASTFAVNIEDNIDPEFNVADGATFTFEANEPRGAHVDLAGSGAVVATDRGETLIPECTATSVDTGTSKLLPDYLAAGEWLVTCTVDGDTIATISVTVNVEIVDLEAPVLTIPAATLNVDADDTTGTAIVDFLAVGGFAGSSITASDNVDTTVEISCSPASGSTFIVGSTPVTCTASDDGPNASGEPNTTTGGFTLVVADVTPPSILTLPVPIGGNLVKEATSAAGAIVTYTVQSSDNADPAPMIACLPVSGSVFPLGETNVTCTATDASGNSSSGAFTVAVEDTTDPVITAPADVTAEANGNPRSTVSIGDALATDDVGPVSIVNDAPADFPLGPTTVTWTATDAHGNSSSDTQTVTVQDTTAPTLSVPDDIGMASTSADGVEVSFAVSATDLFPVATSCVDQDGFDVESGDVFPIGETTVTCTATDTSDNSVSDSFAIDIAQAFGIHLIVPKGQLQRGSTNPIDWQYLDLASGDVIDSGFIEPVVNWIGPYKGNDSDCSGATSGAGSGDDAGSSDKRYSESNRTWQLSWKTPDMKGRFLLIISPPGIGDPAATACVRLR